MKDERDTKERILDAAEAVFAERGYGAASLREVTRAARVNLAAVHYHFGSKLALFRAVFERRVGDINAERLARLDELEAAHPAGVPVEALLEAFLAPALRRAARPDGGWTRFLRLVGLVHAEGGERADVLREVFRTVIDRFFPAFQRSLPHLELEDVHWRASFLIGGLCHVFTDGGRLAALSAGRCDARDTDAALRELVAFVSAGMRAPRARPAPARTRRGARA